MVNRTSNLINRNRSATKILKVYSSSSNGVDGSVGSGHERRHGGGGERMVDLKQLGVGWLVGVLGRLENKKPRL